MEQLKNPEERFSVEALRSAGSARAEWTRARRRGAGVFDMLRRRAGLDVSLNWSRGMTELLDMDVAEKEKFEALRDNELLAPLAKTIAALGPAGVTSQEGFLNMTGVIGRDEVKKFFKEYASTPEGSRAMGGKTFEDFTGKQATEKMYQMFQGMSGDEKRAFNMRALTSAIEKSQRLINETKRGDTASMPVHVMINPEQVAEMKE